MSVDFKLTHVEKEFKHSAPVISCRFDPKGRFVFAGAEDFSVGRWDLASGTKVAFSAHESWVRAIGFSPDGESLYTGGYDGHLIFWPATADAPKPVKTIDAHTGWVRALSVSPDGRFIATAGNDHLVKVWNAADGSPVRTLAKHDSPVYSVLFHPDGKSLLSGDLSGNVHQWNVETGEAVRSFDAKPLHSYNDGQGVHYGGVRTIAASPDGKLLACGGLHKATNPLGAENEPLVPLFDWESTKLKQSHVLSDVKGIAWRVCFHPEGFLIGCSGGSGGGYIAFWKPEQDKEQFKLKMSDTVRDLDLHPDGIRIATAHYDGYMVRVSAMIAPKA